MAALVARASATAALCAFVLGAACSRPVTARSTPLASVDRAASDDETILRDLDAATGEAYVLATLARGGTIGDAQPCVMGDNRASRRASALADPPYAPASIAQRGDLVRALGAFAILKTALARSVDATAARPELANFQAAAFELRATANVHARGDLFVDEGAADLFALAARLRAVASASAARALEAARTSAIEKLVGIARDDATQRRLEAMRAALVAANLASEQATPAVPACDEPIVPRSAPSLVPEQNATGAPLLRDARARSLARIATLEARSLDGFFDDLRAIVEASPSDATTLAGALDSLAAATDENVRR